MTEIAWTDTHCHLQMVDDAPAAVADAREQGVSTLICVGTDVANSREAIEAARQYDGVYATVGLHPHDAKDLTEALPELQVLCQEPGVVAIGECGLDYFRDQSPRPDQRDAFRAQIALAKAKDLALIIHTRDAWHDTFAVLEAHPLPERFVFHCFSGGVEEAERCLELGGYLSIAGPISYPKNDHLREAAAIAPLDRLVVETDSPFLPPQRFRGKPNYPSLVPLVGEALADALAMPIAEVAALTTANAARLFNLGE